MNSKCKYKIMFVDDESYVRSMLTLYFQDKFEMVALESAAAALEALAHEKFDLVISDVRMPGMDGPYLLAEIQKKYPDVKRALLTSSNIDDHIIFARENDMGSIIPKTIPFNFEEVENIIMGLLTGDIFGVTRYLRREDNVDVQHFCVKSTAEARVVRDEIVARLEEKFQSAGEMKLTLEEIIMNAIYHAPQRDGAEEKYAPYTNVTLEPHEYVHVEFAADSEKYAVSVLDNCGALTRDTVLQKMERQITGAGIMDDSGRGLHMCRLFADRLIINIERGKRTEVIILNYIGGKYRGFKPLYINEL